MEYEGWTRDLLIFLVAAGIVVPFLSRFRLGVVLGFILAGLVLGPGGLGALTEEAPWLEYITFHADDGLTPLADLGVMFLLFTIGLELSVDRLWQMRRLVFGAGTAQVLLSTIVLGAGILAIGVAISEAVIFGLGLAFSSTAIVLQLLIEHRRFGGDTGRVSMGILLMQDLMVVPGVILVTILAGDGDESVPVAILRGIGLAAAAVAVIALAGRFLLRPLLAAAASTHSREIMVAIALLLAIAAAFATSAAGLSPALGALLAGILLGSSEYRHQVEVDIEPFKGLLLGLFFMTVGMGIDLRLVAEQLLPMLGAVLGLLVVKGAVVYGSVRAFRLRHATAVETAFLLAGAGEFAFVLFTVARQEGLLGWDDTRFITTVAALSMVLTPILGGVGRRLAARLERGSQARGDPRLDADPAELAGHVVIGGYGRVGEMVARTLDASNVAYVALDVDARRVASGRADGRTVYYGDISRPEILERIGAARARAFVITSDLPAETDRTVAVIKETWPDALVFARAKDPAHARRLEELGTADAVPEAFEGSLQLAARVLDGIGFSATTVADTIATARQEAKAGPARL